MSDHKKSVLIVEDDPEIRALYARALTASGLTVFTAEDGEDGLMLAKEKRPDILLLDVLLPKMSGMDLLKQVRAYGDWGEHVPAILLTNVEPTSEQMTVDIAYTTPTFYLLKNFVTVEEVVIKIHERLKEQV
jgi:DNA-binding response OmpR family regulator